MFVAESGIDSPQKYGHSFEKSFHDLNRFEKAGIPISHTGSDTYCIRFSFDRCELRYEEVLGHPILTVSSSNWPEGRWFLSWDLAEFSVSVNLLLVVEVKAINEGDLNTGVSKEAANAEKP